MFWQTKENLDHKVLIHDIISHWLVHSMISRGGGGDYWLSAPGLVLEHWMKTSLSASVLV